MLQLNQYQKTSGSPNKREFYCYILTEDEEKLVIYNAISNLMQRKATRFKNYGASISKIEQVLKDTNFEAMIDRFDLLNTANVRKCWEIERQQSDKARIEQEKKEQIELEEKHTAQFFFKLIKQSFLAQNKQLVLDDNSNPYIKFICLFMAKDPRFETELGYDLYKGLWVIGNAGLGKTRLIEAVSNNQLAPIKIVSMLQISNEIASNGEFDLELTTCKKILLDDVGSEQATVKHFGTSINWFKDFIELYYANRTNFNKLLVTTNCDFNEIEDKYGYRARSRVREMFNIFYIKGEDRRK